MSGIGSRRLRGPIVHVHRFGLPCGAASFLLEDVIWPRLQTTPGCHRPLPSFRAAFVAAASFLLEDGIISNKGNREELASLLWSCCLHWPCPKSPYNPSGAGPLLSTSRLPVLCARLESAEWPTFCAPCHTSGAPGNAQLSGPRSIRNPSTHSNSCEF